MSSSPNPFDIAWIDISSMITSRNIWVDVDISSLSPPANVVGVIVYQATVDLGVAREAFGIRKNGSTDDGSRVYRSNGPGGDAGITQSGKTSFCGVDANGIFEVNWANNKGRTEKIFITGWATSDHFHFFDNFVVIEDTLTGQWRTEWVDTNQWHVLDMTPAHYLGSAPLAYVMYPCNGHWGTGSLDFIPANQQGAVRAESCSLGYDTHHTAVVVPVGDGGNVEFRTYANSSNIEVQVVGIVHSGYERIDPQFTLATNTLQEWTTFNWADAGELPEGSIAVSLRIRAGAAGAWGGVRKSPWSGDPDIFVGAPPYSMRAISLIDVSSPQYDTMLKWSSCYVTGAFLPASLPPLDDQFNYVGDSVNVDVSW